MTALSDTVPEVGSVGPSAAPTRVRPFYWSVRRELWENRSITIAPLAAAAVVLFGFLVSTVFRSHMMGDGAATGGVKHAVRLAEPYDFACFAITVTTLLVALFYCLGALHGERRDRGILFWKSLPVSDLTTVLAKASVPMVILPLVALAVALATQLIMLALNTLVLWLHGLGAASVWASAPLIHRPLDLVYGLTVLALWNAPIYGWLLLVSGWARRTVFLWAFLPPLALCVVEKIAFGTGNFASLLIYRITGSFSEGFTGGNDSFRMDPLKFLRTPGLWLGLAFAAAFLAAAVWQRRRREPI
jgi:ABC-2 type transport system permease protein